jgi:hypothetical protein
MTKPPDASDFTWDNQGTASVNETNGGIVFTLPGTVVGAGGFDLRVLYKAAPSIPYTITTCFIATLFNLAAAPRGFNVGWRQSSDGKLSTLSVDYDNGTGFNYYRVRKFTSTTVYSADYANTAGRAGSGIVVGPIWLQIEDDNSNRICRISADGQNFTQIHSVGRTDFLTADQVCWGGLATTNGTDTSYLNLLSWEED